MHATRPYARWTALRYFSALSADEIDILSRSSARGERVSDAIG